MVIGAISAAMISAIWLIRERSKIEMENMRLREMLKDRTFEAKYDDLRRKVEIDIADLQRNLTSNYYRNLQANGLPFSAQTEFTENNDTINFNKFFKALRIDNSSIKIDEKLVFVLTPFHESEFAFYSTIIRAFSGTDINVQRGDEELIEGEILPHIIEKILKAKIVIANITTRNPNVFYELGIAHALGKDVIIVSAINDLPEEVPFDFRSRRIIFYNNAEALENQIKKAVLARHFS